MVYFRQKHAMKLKASLIQHHHQGSRAANQQYIADQIKLATQQGARLIVLQELHDHAYFCQTEEVDHFDLAEIIPGPSSQFFAALADQHQCVIVSSLFEQRTKGLYHNTAVVFDTDGKLAGLYRKMHIPEDPGFHEKFYFTPGDLGFTPIQTNIGKLGVLICWDQWYPEAARLMALAGAELLIYPTAIGWDPLDESAEQQRQLAAWRTIQVSHAISNALPVLSCNRVGHEPSPRPDAPGIDFWGHSFVCGPQGEMIAQADQSDETLIAEIDLDRTETLRRIWPFLRDRRIDAYAGLNERFLSMPQRSTS